MITRDDLLRNSEKHFRRLLDRTVRCQNSVRSVAAQAPSGALAKGEFRGADPAIIPGPNQIGPGRGEPILFLYRRWASGG